MNEQPGRNRPRPRQATLSDVAARAGGSTVTASRVLRQPQMVSADLRQRVTSSIEALALALGTQFECNRRDLSVPVDLSIIGFNDLEICASSLPSLSSVATPRCE